MECFADLELSTARSTGRGRPASSALLCIPPFLARRVVTAVSGGEPQPAVVEGGCAQGITRLQVRQGYPPEVPRLAAELRRDRRQVPRRVVSLIY